MVSSRTHLVCLCATRTRDCAPGWAVECAGRGHEAAQPGTGHVRRRRLHRPARAEPSRAEPRGPFEARVEPTDGTRSARASGGQRDEHGMAMSVKYRTDVHTTRRGRRGVDRRPVRGGVTIARKSFQAEPPHDSYSTKNAFTFASTGPAARTASRFHSRRAAHPRASCFATSYTRAVAFVSGTNTAPRQRAAQRLAKTSAVADKWS